MFEKGSPGIQGDGWGAVAAEPGGGLGGLSPPNEKSGGVKVCLAPPIFAKCSKKRGPLGEYEVGAEHILDREVPFPAIWGVCKAKNFFVRSAPTDGGAPLR